MNPKVSVIIPVYGVEKYIERCADSLFAQTLSDIEFIFVDDCSPDRSMELLNQKIEKNRPRFAGMNWQVRTVRMPTNSGLAAVRRHGIQLAMGNFVIHCDSDDWVEPDMYKVMYEKAVEEDADVVVCDCCRTNGKVNEYISVGKAAKPSKIINQMLHRRVWWSLCNKLFRKELYDDITYPTGAMGEDMCICMQLMTKCNNISFVHCCYYYYINPKSIIQNNSIDNIIYKYNEICGNVAIVQDYYKQKSLSRIYAKGLNYLEYNATQALLPGLYDEKVMALWKTTFPGCFRNVLFDSSAQLKERVRCLLIILGLYTRKKRNS